MPPTSSGTGPSFDLPTMASQTPVPNSHWMYDLETDRATIPGHTSAKRWGADARDDTNWTRNSGKSKDDPVVIDDDEEVQEVHKASSIRLSQPGTSWRTLTNQNMANPTHGLATFQTTNSTPQSPSDSRAGSSTLAGAPSNNIKTVSHISSESAGALSLSSFVRTQSGQTSAAPTRPPLTSPSNHSSRLHRKRKDIERPNLSSPVGKKRRVDLIDEGDSIYVDRRDGFEALSLQRSIIPHGFSSGNMNYQSNVQSEHPPSVHRSSSQTALALSPTQSSHRPCQPSTSRIVPQLVHRIIGGNNPTLPITQEASTCTPPHRQGQLSLSDLKNNPSRPPKTTPKKIPKTGNPSNDFINLCSSEDEDPMDNAHRAGGRSSRTQAQDDGSLSGGESDSDYWSICLSDDYREEPIHTPDQASKVQPTYTQKGWIPPTSIERYRLNKPLKFTPAYHFLHKQTSFFHTILDLRTSLATGRIKTPRRKERALDTFWSPLRSDMIQKCAELTMGMGINFVTQSEHQVFIATRPGRQESPALNVYNTIAKCTVPVEPENRFMHPMHEIGVDPANSLRVLTTEYADWAEMDPNQADQKCVRIWDWSEAEDSSVGRFTEADSWEYDARPMGIVFNPDRKTWRQEDGELSMCAIGCGSGQLMIHYSRNVRERVTVVDPVHKQHVSSLLWGCGPTSNILFAGTMEDRDSGSSGHIATVSLRSDLVTVMDTTQNIGEVDALGISPQGDRLAACIRGHGLPSLEIYALDNSGIQNSSKSSTRSTRHPTFGSSVSSSSSSAQARISLEPFDTPQAEVSFCKWSPCGTYIAVGRNDDRVDMFDSRFIKDGPVSRMFHGEPIRRTPWKSLWGITGLEWVEGAGPAQQALVSGGTDGCVRLWDIRHADPVCDTLAEMEADIASFSIGDIGRREAPLVVADSEGTVVVLSDIGAAKEAGFADW